MKKLFIFLVAVFAAFWFGNKWVTQHGGNSFWDTLSNPGKSAPGEPAASGTSTPPLVSPDKTIAGVRVTLTNVEQKLLVPINEDLAYPVETLSKALEDAQLILNENQGHADYNKLQKATGLLTQAIFDRGTFLQRYKNEMAKPAASSSSLQPSTTNASSGSFFKDAIIRGWAERCGFYHTSIDPLLLPPA